MNTQRTIYLIAYDICHPKRLAKVHRLIEGYAIGGQKSFYECWVTKNDLAHIKDRLATLINEKEDRVYFFQLFENTERQFYGKAHIQSIKPFLFI